MNQKNPMNNISNLDKKYWLLLNFAVFILTSFLSLSLFDLVVYRSDLVYLLYMAFAETYFLYTGNLLYFLIPLGISLLAFNKNFVSNVKNSVKIFSILGFLFILPLKHFILENQNHYLIFIYVIFWCLISTYLVYCFVKK